MGFINGSDAKKKIIRLTVLIVTLVATFATIALWGSVVENVPAGKIVVIQNAIDGELNYYTTPGMKLQKFGKVTIYNKSSQYWFSVLEDQGGKKDRSIRVRFNDGGHANVSGSVRFDLPFDKVNLQKIHSKYGSQSAIEQELVRTVFEKSVYMSGPIMSSKESYAEKRNDLITFIEDQALRGVYKTLTKETKGIDQLSGKEKTVTRVELIKDSDSPNGIARQEASPLAEFGIKAYNLSINKIKYDGTVEAQIKKQQQSIMAVQTAMADAKKAEQDAIKAEKEGEAKAATAKWKQEVIKAQKVTEAEQNKEVARLDKETAKFTKEKEILLGQGEAERKRLVMSADGALEKKLATYIEVNKMYATAMATYQGDWVPKVSMGQSNGGTNGAQDLISMLSAKTAKELALDMSIKK